LIVGVRRKPMMEDRYLENDPAPLFLAGPFEEAEQTGLRRLLSSDVFRKAVLAFGAASTLFAVVWVVKAIVFSTVTASEASSRAPIGGKPALAIESTSAIQSNTSTASSNAQAAPATPASDGLLAAFKAAVETKADADQPGAKPTVEPGTDALLNQFKSWATEGEVQAPAQQPEPPQIARTDVDRAEAVQAARAEIVPSARGDVVPLPKRRPTHVDQAARAHEPPPPPPSLLRQLGFHN
jgi:hypothetical protein